MALSISYSFSPTTTIESGQVNQNFSDIVSYINSTACVTGMVVAWSGAIVDIPTGWALDTNARDKFIIGAGNLYNPGDSGGEATHTLTSDEMPAHTHTQTAHSHLQVDSGATMAEQGNDLYVPAKSGHNNHSSQSVTATNQNTGGGGAHNNLPPYYAYALIKKS